MRCSVSKLPLYLDGVLDAEESGQVQAHLEECPACRALTRLETSPFQALPRLDASVLGRMGRQLEGELREALENPVRLRAACAVRAHSSHWGLAWVSGVCVGVLFTWGAARVPEPVPAERLILGAAELDGWDERGGAFSSADLLASAALFPRKSRAGADRAMRSPSGWELSSTSYEDVLHFSALSLDVWTPATPHCPLHR